MPKSKGSELYTAFGDDYDDDNDTVATEKPKRKGFVGFLINNWFMLTTIIGVIIGFGAGFGIQQAGLDEVGKTWLGKMSFAKKPIFSYAWGHLHSTSKTDYSSNDRIKHYKR